MIEIETMRQRVCRRDKFISAETKLTYDDVLLCPRESLGSRRDADVSQRIEGIGLVSHPIIPANMDSIASATLLQAAWASGGLAIGHRYMPFGERLHPIDPRRFISVGVTEQEIAYAESACRTNNPFPNFCIDIAHGHSPRVYEAINRIKDASDGESVIIAGNIATVEGFHALVEAGADIIKVGVGPGSHCTTRLVTGCGYPQLSAVLEICEARDAWVRERDMRYVPVIADGGIKHSGDIVKALVAGADFVMTGSLFSGCAETPGDAVEIDGKMRKVYRGMASRDAQLGWFGRDVVAPEGETSFVDPKPPFEQILKSLIGGLQSGMSYLGCTTLTDLRLRAMFVRVSANTLIENHPHGKQ
jgi:IMP dehydrogenase